MPRTDDHTVLWVRVPLDEETAARLRNLSDLCHADPISVAASLLHDILKEDAEAHHLLEVMPASPSIN